MVREQTAEQQDRDAGSRWNTGVAAPDLLAIALEAVEHGLCVFDADLVIRLSNQRMRDLFGMPEEVVRPGATMYGLVKYSAAMGRLGGMPLKEAWRRRLALIARGRPFARTERFPDGRVISISYRPTGNGGWVATHQDITAQQRLEDELRAQARRFGQALDNMSHGLAMFDAGQRLIVCNAQYVQMFGFDPAVIRPGVSLFDVLRHSVERGLYSGLSLRQLCEDARRRIAEGGEHTGVRHLPDGRCIFTRSRSLPEGGWIFTCEDVTDRERAAEALREQHRRFDAALNNMAHGLCMFDADNRLIVCNHVYVSIFNADPEVVKPGVTLREIFEHGVATGIYPGLTADDLVARRLAVLARGGMQSYDQAMADGRTISVSIRPMEDGGWLGMFEDVTDQRRAEAIQASTMLALHEQNLVMDATLENMAQGLCVYDQDFRVIVRNRRYLELYGLSEDEVRPGTPLIEVIARSVARGVHKCGIDAQTVYREFTERLAHNQEPVLHRQLADGRIVAMRIQPMANGGWVATFEDITERERAAEELREQHRRFDAALNNMAHGLCMLDEELNLIVCNRRYLDMYGLSPEIVKPGVTMRAIVEHSIAVGNYVGITAAEIVKGYIDRLAAGQYLSHRELADGRIFKVLYHPMEHGGWVAVHEDVTERRKVEQHIVHMAHHDALTGLPNRVLFRERMADGLVKVQATGEPLALLCLDLDHFKAVNDTLGHPVGDQLLTAVACRLGEAVGRAGTIARLGGDEFAILLHAADPPLAEALARRLVRAMADPFVVDGHLINTGLSIGIAMAPQDGSAADHLMKCADLALYRAKSEGRGMVRFFEPDMGRRLQARRELELDLRQALAAEEFSLVFQPVVRAATRELRGFEALLRWNQRARGPVPPADFIPLAEETGLILPIGEWVLRHACAEAARWPVPLKVAVNLSPVQFKNRKLVAVVLDALSASGLAPDRLELEITEAVLLQNDEATIAMLHALRSHGIRIAMDDFGVGYSSLSYLRSFPFDKIKIDRSFIADLDRSRDNAAIVRATAGLGASLGIDTTAEGVETAEQLTVVRHCGCTEVQGYLISPPRAAAELASLISDLRRQTDAAGPAAARTAAA